MENEQRPTRGRLSKVDLLPDSIREQLHQMLREKGTRRKKSAKPSTP